MERFIGLVLFLIAIYVGITLYTEGARHAFGGLFAVAGEASGPDDGRTPTQRAGDRVRRDLDADLARKERLLPE